MINCIRPVTCTHGRGLAKRKRDKLTGPQKMNVESVSILKGFNRTPTLTRPQFQFFESINYSSTSSPPPPLVVVNFLNKNSHLIQSALKNCCPARRLIYYHILYSHSGKGSSRDAQSNYQLPRIRHSTHNTRNVDQTVFRAEGEEKEGDRTALCFQVGALLLLLLLLYFCYLASP